MLDKILVDLMMSYSPRSFDGIRQDAIKWLVGLGFDEANILVTVLIRPGDTPPEGLRAVTEVPSLTTRGVVRVVVVNGGTTPQNFALSRAKAAFHLDVQRDGVTVLAATPVLLQHVSLSGDASYQKLNLKDGQICMSPGMVSTLGAFVATEKPKFFLPEGGMSSEPSDGWEQVLV